MFSPVICKTTITTPLVLTIAGVAGASVANLPGALMGTLISLGAGIGGVVATIEGVRLAVRNVTLPPSTQEILTKVKIDRFAKEAALPIATLAMIELIWAEKTEMLSAMLHAAFSITLGSALSALAIARGLKAILVPNPPAHAKKDTSNQDPNSPSHAMAQTMARIICAAFAVAGIGGAIAGSRGNRGKLIGIIAAEAILITSRIAAIDIAVATRRKALA